MGLSDITVYTTIINGRDELHDPPPEAIGDGVRYVCFTNDPELTSEVWEIRAAALSHVDATKAARWHKWHPHKVVGETEYSMWVDGSLVPVLHPKLLFDMFLSDADVAAFPHRHRDCIYQEIEECLSVKKAFPLKLINQGKALYASGHPENAGMFETGVLLRRHTEDVIELSETVWENIRQFSDRDQVGFNALRCMMGVACADMGPGNVRDTPYFDFNPHEYRKSLYYRDGTEEEDMWKNRVVDNANTDKKVLIIGTGRCGTTYLIQFLTLLGLDTGYELYKGKWVSKLFERAVADADGNISFVDRTTPVGWYWQDFEVLNRQINAGMERNIGPNDTRKSLKGLPKYIKNPRLNVGLERVVAEQLLDIQEVLLPVRSLESVTKSKQESGKLARGMKWFQDKKDELRKDSAAQLGELMTTLIVHDIPYRTLQFPRIVHDMEYLRDCLGDLVAHVPEDEFHSAFQQLADKSKVHFDEIYDSDDSVSKSGDGATGAVLDNTADAQGLGADNCDGRATPEGAGVGEDVHRSDEVTQ